MLKLGWTSTKTQRLNNNWRTFSIKYVHCTSNCTLTFDINCDWNTVTLCRKRDRYRCTCWAICGHKNGQMCDLALYTIVFECSIDFFVVKDCRFYYAISIESVVWRNGRDDKTKLYCPENDPTGRRVFSIVEYDQTSAVSIKMVIRRSKLLFLFSQFDVL